MCTIGYVMDPTSKQHIIFKQCDLVNPTTFNPPGKVSGKGDIVYVPFTRQGCSGPWAGVNNKLVSFVAADAYINHPLSPSPSGDIFEAYTKIISDYPTAKEAADYMVGFYKTFAGPDILLISDANNAYFIEHSPDYGTACFKREDGFFASTNHFRVLDGAVAYEANHSTYLRLERAEAILEKEPNLDGVFETLRDQYYGETELSICRVAQKNTEYYTQATAIFVLYGTKADCYYQLNGNPRNNDYTHLRDIFGSSD